MKRKHINISAAILALIAIAVGGFMFASGEINDYTISEADAQAKINSKVSLEEPWEKTKEILLVDFRLVLLAQMLNFTKTRFHYLLMHTLWD